MNNFYLNYRQYGNQVLIRGYREGKRFISKEKFKPTLYSLSNNNSDSKYKSLFDENLKPHKFEDINGAKEFVKKYQHVHNFKIFGNTSYHFQWCNEIYPGIVEYDVSLIKTMTLDIETSVGTLDASGNTKFPDYFDPMERITLIACKDRVTKKIVTFGCWEYTPTRPDMTYVLCKDEADLYMKFLAWWEKEEVDVITGYNTDGFDIPYMCERMIRIVGQDNAKRLSPFGIIKSREFDYMGEKKLSYEIYGISSLDMMLLYQKFTYSKQESYKLDHIGEVELGMKKLENPYSTFKEWYENDPKMFIDYNAIDCDLVDALEGKLKLIELAISMGFMAHINFDDVYSPVKMWDTIIYNHLMDKNIVPPLKEENFGEDRSIQGAYVKEPVPGKYGWLLAEDAASLYPNIIRTGNMSPETILPTMQDISVCDLLKGDRNKVLDGIALAANGSQYSTEKEGFLPKLMEYYYNQRKVEKKKMLSMESDLERMKENYAGMPNQELSDLMNITKNKIASSNALQMALKIAINSAS